MVRYHAANGYKGITGISACVLQIQYMTVYERIDYIMDVGLILKVAGVGITVSIAYQILSKYGREEQAILVSLAGIIIVMLMLTDKLGGLFSSIRSIFGL